MILRGSKELLEVQILTLIIRSSKELVEVQILQHHFNAMIKKCNRAFIQGNHNGYRGNPSEKLSRKMAEKQLEINCEFEILSNSKINSKGF